MTKVSLNLYGAFRQLGVGQLTLQVPDSATVMDLREAFESYLLHRSLNDKSSVEIPRQLIQASVFASDKAILKDADSLGRESTLSLFPPVCGG